ncbi:hypothetical protein D3C76_1299960 [compost metagenome]
MGIGRAVQFVGGTHGFRRERRRGIGHQGHVVAQFRGEAAGGLDAGIGQHSDQDHPLHPVLLELVVEVGVGEAAGAPVLLDHHVLLRRLEVRVPFPTPAAHGEHLGAAGAQLVGAGVLPGLEIVGARPVVRHVEDLDPRLAHRRQHLAQVVQGTDGIRHGLGEPVELAAFAEKIVVRVHQQQAGALTGIGHRIALAGVDNLCQCR